MACTKSNLPQFDTLVLVTQFGHRGHWVHVGDVDGAGQILVLSWPCASLTCHTQVMYGPVLTTNWVYFVQWYLCKCVDCDAPCTWPSIQTKERHCWCPPRCVWTVPVHSLPPQIDSSFKSIVQRVTSTPELCDEGAINQHHSWVQHVFLIPHEWQPGLGYKHYKLWHALMESPK